MEAKLGTRVPYIFDQMNSVEGKDKFEKLLGRGLALGCKMSFIGSRTVNFASTADSDFDIVVHDVDRWQNLEYWLHRNSFEMTKDSLGRTPDFRSYKDPTGRFNFIFAKDLDFYTKTVAANNICVDLEIVDKDTRIKVFEFMREEKGAMDGNSFAKLLEEESNQDGFRKGQRSKTSAMGGGEASVPF